MLIEMHSPVFKEKGSVRPPVKFGPGLNVVLGKENGENSIGKSSALLVIDFVFGGNTYLKSDAVHHIGDHTVFFTFCFEGKEHYFARSTADAEYVHVCTSDFRLRGAKWERAKFTDWLKQMYHMDFPGLSFRSTLSSFFRIYGKENTDERKPLRGLPGQSMEKSIDVLVKLFDRYKDIEIYNGRLEEQKKKLSVFREARRYRFVPDLVGGKPQYEENITIIRELEAELENLTETQSVEADEQSIEKARIKAELTNQKIQLETQLQAFERRLKLISMSMEFGLYPTDADLSALQEFFPGVNLRKIYEVERYHQKLAAILGQQFEEERQSVEAEITQIKVQLEVIKEELRKLGFVGNLTKEFLDKHAEIKGRIDALKAQNNAFLTLNDLQDARRIADEQLKRAIKDVLSDLQGAINGKMKEYNDTLFSDSRKAPHVSFYEYNSYHFETPDDTGTGSNYKGLVIYDLAILSLTALPAIAHDSLILKNISDESIDGIMRIYEASDKQIFIAFDKQAAYKEDTRRILLEHTVLKLSDGNCELYGESWNKENAQ